MDNVIKITYTTGKKVKFVSDGDCKGSNCYCNVLDGKIFIFAVDYIPYPPIHHLPFRCTCHLEIIGADGK